MKKFRPRFKREEQAAVDALKESLEKRGFQATLALLRGDDTANTSVEIDDQGDVVIEGYSNVADAYKDLQSLNVNLDDYEIQPSRISTWQAQAKGGQVITMRAVRTRLIKNKNTAEKIAGRIEQTLREVLPSMKVPKLSRSYAHKGYTLLPFLTDHHIGKIAYDKDNTLIWNTKIASEVYKRAVEYFYAQFKDKPIKQIILPVGSDLLNIDNPANTTTAGTHQEAGEYWEHQAVVAEACLIYTIELLKQIAPVQVVLVRGNHDYNSVFMLGRILQAYYTQDKDVVVVNTSSTEPRLYLQQDKVALAFSHGHQAKAKNLDRLFANEAPDIWGNTSNRYVFTGHYHSQHKRSTYTQSEVQRLNGCTVFTCDALCPADRWHQDSGYTGSVQQTQAFLFDDSMLVSVSYYQD